MFSNREKILDDIARVAGGAISTLSGVRQNIREDVKSRADEIATRLDLVPREDFEALETRVKEQDNRIKQLEKQLSTKSKKTTKPKTPKKPAKKTKKQGSK